MKSREISCRTCSAVVFFSSAIHRRDKLLLEQETLMPDT
jgi:hypothetical protein